MQANLSSPFLPLSGTPTPICEKYANRSDQRQKKMFPERISIQIGYETENMYKKEQSSKEKVKCRLAWQ
jgi:hypothetical protein